MKTIQKIRDAKIQIFAGAVLLTLIFLGLAPVSGLLAAGEPGTGPGGVGSTDGNSALRLWLQVGKGMYTDAGCVSPANTGAQIACWADQSGNGNHVVQVDPTYQPRYLSTTAVEFDTDIMSTTHDVQLFATPSSGLSAIVVFNTGVYTENSVLLNYGASAGSTPNRNLELGYTFSSAGDFGLHRGNDNATLANTARVANDRFVVFSTFVLPNGTNAVNSLQVYTGGLQVPLSVSGAGWLVTGDYPTNAVPLNIGARCDGNQGGCSLVDPDAFHKGYISEIIVFTQTLNTAQRVIIENYLSAKYYVKLDPSISLYGTTNTMDVIGIGKEADGIHAESRSAGLILSNGTFLKDNGDYIMVGHNVKDNVLTDAPLPPGVDWRWTRRWYYRKTDVGSNGGSVTLKFDFSDAGISETPNGLYALLGRSHPSVGTFRIVQTSSYIEGDQVIFTDTEALKDGWFYTIGKISDMTYFIEDSKYSAKITYDFEDISSTGTELTFATGRDEMSGAVPLNFTFNFYDRNYTQIYVSTNGFLTFLSGQSAGDGTPIEIPTVDVHNGLIAGWWNRLDLQVGGAVYYETFGTAPNQYFVLQFDNVPLRNSPSVTSTFQIKLFESSNVVEVHYLDVSTDVGDFSLAGIESHDATKGGQYYYADAHLHALAVRYARPPLLLETTVNDLTPRVGDRITYTIVVRSNLKVATNTAVLTETLDDGLLFVSDALGVTPPQPSLVANYNGQTLQLSNFSLAAGGWVTFTVPVTVASSAEIGAQHFVTVTLAHSALSDPWVNIVDVIPDNCWVNVDGSIFDNVQEGVDVADVGGEVKIAGYCLDVDSRADIEQLAYINKTLTLRGGYTQNNWSTANPLETTVLDAQDQGRVVFVVPGIVATLENLHLVHGNASESGSTLSEGGGLYMNSSALTMNTVQVYGNIADQGAGIYVYTGTFTLNNGHVFTNVASTGGGGLYLLDSDVLLRNTSLAQNSLISTLGRGAGVYALRGTLVVTDNSQIVLNTGYEYGGGAYLESCDVTLQDTAVLSNTADRGAGMYINLCQVSIDESRFGGNVVSNHGGGLYLNNSPALIASSRFAANTSKGRGGAMTIASASAVLRDNVIDSNVSLSDGGGIYATESASITLHNNQVLSNTGSYGGGLYFNVGRLTMEGNTFTSNVASGTGYGGGMYLNLTVPTLISDNTFMANRAYNGGGFYLLDGATAVIAHNEFNANDVSNLGGGVFVRRGEAQIYENRFVWNTSDGTGGGLYLTNGTPTVFLNEIVSNTASSGYGGGASFNSTDGVVITQNLFTANSAPSGGGAMYVNYVDDAVITANTIVSNVTPARGGGIYFQSSSALCTSNTIEYNHASSYGGGLYVNVSYPVFEQNNIRYNTASSKGGGAYVLGGSAILRHNTVVENTSGYTFDSGAGLYLNGGTPTVEYNNVVSNTAMGSGGGLYISNVTGATLNDNMIADNVATRSGGGIYVYHGIQQLARNTVRNNRASYVTSGGGIYLEGVNGSSSALFVRNLISENRAQGQGGGIYMNASSTAVFDGNRILHNTAQTDGGGIRLSSSSSRFVNNVVADNTVVSGNGSGIYVERSNANFLHTTLARNTGGSNIGVYLHSNGIFTTSFTNTILISHTVGISVTSGNTAILNATMWGNTLNWGGRGYIVRVAPDVYGNPDFVDPNAGDYRIGINSEAVDVGADSGVPLDIEGEMRPLGHGYDLGADEYGGRCYVRLNNNPTLYMTVQAAVNASTNANDVVKVAGVCAGVQTIAGLTQNVYLNKPLTIQGGYSLTHWTSSNPVLYPTTLDARGMGRVLYVTSGVSATVRNLNITGGDAALGGGNNSGGGVYVNNATLTLYRTAIFSNTAINGGGVYIYQGNASRLTLNTIKNNNATNGGGIYLDQSRAQAEANHILLNAAARGGGLYLNASNARFTNNVIVNNVATNQGSGVYVSASAPAFSHLTVARNSGGDASGIRLASNSTASITNTVILDHGTGIVAETGSSATMNSTYWGNGDWANTTNWSGAVTHQNDYFDGDPAFVAPDDYNYHIGSTSALINLGVLTNVAVDLDGFVRDRLPDLGADEFRTCWARLNDSPVDYASVQDAVDASNQSTDVVKIAGYCAGVLVRPRNDIVTTGVVSQVVYLTKTLTLQGGYTATDFTTPYPLLQPTILDALNRGRVVYVTGNVHPTIVGLHLIGGNAGGLGGHATADAGGGLYVATGSVTVDGSRIYLNAADVGGGAHVAFGDLLLRNTVVADNQTSVSGGAVQAWDATLRNVHATLARNTGIGIYLENNSTGFVTNTILVEHPLGVDVATGSSVNLLATLWGNTVDWDDADPNIYTTSDYWGNPAFVAPDDHNYHITFASAAIDRGVDAGVAYDGDFGERPTGNGYDIGAYEFPEAFTVTKVANPTVVLSGENITYTISITNTGHVDLQMTVMDQMPAHMVPGGQLFWQVGLEPGAVWSRQLVGNVEFGYLGVLTNTVSVTTTTGITGQYVCLADASISADLRILKTASASSLTPGSRLTYTLSYVNAGPSPTSGVRITDIIPTTLENVQIVTTPPITAAGGVNYAWDAGNLIAGAGGTITISGVVAEGIPGGTVIANTASIMGAMADGDLYNNYAGPVNVSVENVPPVAVDDNVVVNEDAFTEILVLGNDDDINGDTLSIVSVSTPAHGQATVNMSTTVIYTPTSEYSGPDTFTYVISDGTATDTATVNVTVLALNDPPVAVNDAYTTSRNTPLGIPAPGVLGNDWDVDSASLVVFKDSNLASGSVTLLTTGAFNFTPAFNFVGVVSFTYHIFDGGTTSNIATVVITVTFDNSAPVAQDDWYYALVNTPLSVPAPGVLGNDTDANGDTLTAVRDTDPVSGTLSLASNGSFVFTPTTDFEGVTTFTYHADDTWDDSNVATVHITVTAGNVPPMAQNDSYVVSEDISLVIAPLQGVLANDTDLNEDPLTAVLNTGPANGLLTLRADGSLIYTPTHNFYGNDSFTYHAYDGLADSNEATVQITVMPVNDPPVFTSTPVLSAVIDQPYTYLITVDDPDGDALAFTAPTLPAWLTLTLIEPTRLTGTPSVSELGNHIVVLEVSDGIAEPVQQSFVIRVSETAANYIYLPLVVRGR
ncbi:MAG: tandem-95 repeat protein [Anaerolineae bacterium]|nr:tandem-95 repeat protein [Anaerolineae bacterium]